MNSKKGLGPVRYVAVWVLMMAVPLTTLAQNADKGGQKMPLADLDLEELMKQDVVVTPQKRPQPIQGVGITMSVLTGQELTRKNIFDIAEVATSVPNVQVNYGSDLLSFNIRGIGANEFATNFDFPIAIHIDEAYLSKGFMAQFMLFDLDRVETLKGPQGTLFGRNATGGTINFFTRRPTDEFSAAASVSHGDYATTRGEAYISGPLGHGLSARLSGMLVEQDLGFYRNLTLGRREKAEHKAAGRAQIQWEKELTEVLLSVNYGRVYSSGIDAYEGIGIFTPESLAAGTPVFCEAYLRGTAAGDDPNCVRGTDGRNSGDDDPYTTINNLRHEMDNDGSGSILRVDHHLAWGTVTAISSFQNAQRQWREDSDGSPVSTIDVYWNGSIDQFSQELRLGGESRSQRWNYVVGGFFEHDKFKSADYLTVGAGVLPGFYSPFTQKVNALAFFLHNDIKLTQQLSLIAGVRLSREKVGVEGSTLFATGLTGSSSPRPATILGTASDSADIPGGNEQTNNNTSFKIGGQWQPQFISGPVDHFMVYANVSTGFRSGAFNAEFATTQAAFTRLSPETITAYEAGFKSSFADRRVEFNSAVFRYSFKNGFINVDSASSPIPIAINAANIDSQGAELEVRWRPFAGLSLGGNVGLLDSHITSEISNAGVSLHDNETINSPKTTASVDFLYHFPVSSSLKIALAGNAYYRSQQYLEASNSISSLEKSYWLVGGRLSLLSADEKWAVSAWVRNLTQTVYRTYVNDLPTFGFLLNAYGAPRTYGATVSYRF